MLARISVLAMAAAPVLGFSTLPVPLRGTSSHRSQLLLARSSSCRPRISRNVPVHTVRERVVCALAESDHDEMKSGARLQVDDIEALRNWVEVVEYVQSVRS